MREKIVNKIMIKIKQNKKLTLEEEEKVQYGLESIYILVTKLTIISIFSLILGILKEMFIFLLIFNAIRMFAFGLHATKSWICLVSSSIAFLGLPFISKIIVINNIVKIGIGIILILLIFKNSPADTMNRPIINKKRRKKFKIISTVISIIFVTLSLFVNNFLSNCFIFSLLLEAILISPLTYKIFKLPYNNYLNYLERNEEYVFN